MVAVPSFFSCRGFLIMDLPNLTPNERVVLWDLMRNYPTEFYKNKTNFFINEMWRYIREKRVWRISIMGETRGGKSECGSTIAFWYVKLFNLLFKKGHFKDLDVSSQGVLLRELTFEIQYVYDNQQVYKTNLKRRTAEGTLVYGQIHQIDEEKSSIGGIGSYSDQTETENLNNITAKFNQSEIWIQPLQLGIKNCPYGLKVFKKDELNRVNWCLLHKMEQEPNGATMIKFLGWVKIPLHTNEDFRQKYNLLKNEWIKKEISGRADERLQKRIESAKMLLKEYPQYFTFNDKGRCKYTRDEQISLLDMLSANSQIDTNYNYTEKFDIVTKARLFAERMKEISR